MAPEPKARPTLYKTKDIDQAAIMVNKNWKNLRRNVFKEAAAGERYPFYAMSVPDVLKLEHWRPHQELLADGLLKQCTSEDDVIFVSQYVKIDPRPLHRGTLTALMCVCANPVFTASGSAFATRTRTANSSPA